MKKQNRKERAPYEDEIASAVVAEYERRRQERISLERQWELNLNFLAGRQYVGLSPRGEIVEDGKAFFWQSRGVFNHIAPIVESRIAKLGRISPVMSVRAKSDGETESAKLSEQLLKNAFEKLDVKRTVAEATAWSEACGTGFYKIFWDEKAGRELGEAGGEKIYEGDVRVVAVPPFEIYPDSLSAPGIAGVKSLLHARVVSADEVAEAYNLAVTGGSAEIYTATGKKKVEGAVTLLELYERPSASLPLGRLTVVAEGKLLYRGELPYKNGTDGRRDFPFVRQAAVEVTGCFFGQSVVERLIPVQRAFNALKNRKHEFINRLSMGVMNVEDGSVDTDDLEQDGLSPGKILIYRQGSRPPEMLDMSKMPAEFDEEEQSLLNEFTIISGVSDVASSSANATVSSGTALELLIEQDNERLTVAAERVRAAYLGIAKQMLRLYGEFIAGRRLVFGQDVKGGTRSIGARSVSDDVYIENENELFYGESRKKDMLFSLYSSGILKDGEGEIPRETKERVLSLLGYGDLAGDGGLTVLHESKAREENGRLGAREIPADGYDDHRIHIEEHVKYVLCAENALGTKGKANFEKHIADHKRKLREEKPQ